MLCLCFSTVMLLCIYFFLPCLCFVNQVALSVCCWDYDYCGECCFWILFLLFSRYYDYWISYVWLIEHDFCNSYDFVSAWSNRAAVGKELGRSNAQISLVNVCNCVYCCFDEFVTNVAARLSTQLRLTSFRRCFVVSWSCRSNVLHTVILIVLMISCLLFV